MRMRLLTASLLASTVFTSALTSPAQAWDADSVLFSGAISATTENRHRGISQSNGHPSISGNARLDLGSGVYGAVDAASVDFKRIDRDAFADIAFQGGYKGVFDDAIDYDAQLAYHYFAGAENSDLNYWEFLLKGGYDFQSFYGSVLWALSPDYINRSGLTLYYAAALSMPIRISQHEFSLDGHLGFLFPQKKHRYVDEYVMDYAVGVKYMLPQYDAHINLGYVGTNRKNDECREKCEGRAMLSATKSFGL